MQLSQLAKCDLSAPPTSVASERLFSVAGDIYDEKRNRLAPERAEMILFINKNFQLVKGQYNTMVMTDAHEGTLIPTFVCYTNLQYIYICDYDFTG